MNFTLTVIGKQSNGNSGAGYKAESGKNNKRIIMQLERWLKFSKGQQAGAIAAEIMRANVWEGKDHEKFLSSLERALELIDLSISDDRWKKMLLMLLAFRDEVAKFYTGINKTSIKTLYLAI